jgi:hypothetical protein
LVTEFFSLWLLRISISLKSSYSFAKIYASVKITGAAAAATTGVTGAAAMTGTGVAGTTTGV